jgi:hypothetical protein
MSRDDIDARIKLAAEQIATVNIFHESMTRPDGACGWCDGEMGGVHRTIQRSDGVVISCAAGDARLLLVGLRVANEDRAALQKELAAQRAEVALWTSLAIDNLARAKIAESDLEAGRARAAERAEWLSKVIDSAVNPIRKGTTE